MFRLRYLKNRDRRAAQSVEDRLRAIEEQLTVLADAERDKLKSRPHIMAKGVSRLESHWFSRGLITLGSIVALGAIIFSAVTFYIENQARSEERAARRDEAAFRREAQIAAAWEVLLRPVGGNIGKGDALNTILGANNELTGVDLSCKAVGNWRDGECINAPVFQNVNVVGQESSRRSLTDINFSGADIFNLKSQNARLYLNLHNTTATEWVLSDTYLATPLERQGDFSGFTCTDCTFLNMTTDWDLIKASFRTTLVNTETYVPREEIEAFKALEVQIVLISLDEEFIPPPPLAGDGTFTMFTDALPLLTWADNDLYIRDGYPSFVDSVAWPVYEKARYCLSEADALKYDFVSEGEENEIFGFSYLDENDDWQTFSTGIRPDSPQTPYACNLTYEDIRRVIQTQLWQQIEDFQANFREGNCGPEEHAADSHDPRWNPLTCRYYTDEDPDPLRGFGN